MLHDDKTIRETYENQMAEKIQQLANEIKKSEEEAKIKAIQVASTKKVETTEQKEPINLSKQTEAGLVVQRIATEQQQEQTALLTIKKAQENKKKNQEHLKKLTGLHNVPEGKSAVEAKKEEALALVEPANQKAKEKEVNAMVEKTLASVAERKKQDQQQKAQEQQQIEEEHRREREEQNAIKDKQAELNRLKAELKSRNDQMETDVTIILSYCASYEDHLAPSCCWFMLLAIPYLFQWLFFQD